MTQQSVGTFDFTDINAATKNLTTGMKLAIAQSLLTQATTSLEKFENPLAEKAHGLGSALKDFRAAYKVEAENAAKNKAKNEG